MAVVAGSLREQLQHTLGSTHTIERELGGGGMSRVFLAEERSLGRHVVVKVLPPELAADVNAERFRREIQLCARLQHPHIVPVLSAGVGEELLYYTMPFIEGQSLRQRLTAGGPLAVGETLRILREVLHALSYAHRRGVAHRDIKPENILLGEGGAVVADFGIAKALDASASTSITTAGFAIGTPAYMAPEQVAGSKTLDHRADIYAVGIVAYEMLTGRPPFTGDSPEEILAAHISEQPAPVSQRRNIPPAVASLVMRCLAKYPADRSQTADEIWHRSTRSPPMERARSPLPPRLECGRGSRGRRQSAPSLSWPSLPASRIRAAPASRRFPRFGLLGRHPIVRLHRTGRGERVHCHSKTLNVIGR